MNKQRRGDILVSRIWYLRAITHLRDCHVLRVGGEKALKRNRPTPCFISICVGLTLTLTGEIYGERSLVHSIVVNGYSASIEHARTLCSLLSSFLVTHWKNGVFCCLSWLLFCI